MAKSAAGNREKLAALISGIEAEAYERGRADARKALLDRLTAGSGRGVRAGKTSEGRAGKASSPARRAPRGSVPRFVERVLNGHPGSTVSEIAGRAATGYRALDQAGVDPRRAEQRRQAGPLRVGPGALVAGGFRSG